VRGPGDMGQVAEQAQHRSATCLAAPHSHRRQHRVLAWTGRRRPGPSPPLARRALLLKARSHQPPVCPSHAAAPDQVRRTGRLKSRGVRGQTEAGRTALVSASREE
jgi:hypothetical protein